MSTKTVNVSDLSGPALDWAVVKCDEGQNWILNIASFLPNHRLGRMAYSSDWSLAGPIIERERMCIDFDIAANCWLSSSRSDARGNLYKGKTPLEAAMRSHVACKLGDTVEIPEELL